MIQSLLWRAAIALSLTGIAAHASVIDFSTLPGPDGSAFTSYTQSNFTVTNVAGLWYQGLSQGNPAPSINCIGGLGTNTITVTNNGLFTFTSLDLDIDVSGSYFITGTRGGNTVLSQSSASSGLHTISSTNSSVAMDTLTLTIKPVSISAGAYVDNIYLTALPNLSCPPFPNSEEGAPYGPLTCSSSGGSGSGYRFSAQGLPQGLAIDPVSGIVSGSPSAGSRGTYSSIAVSVVDSIGSPNSVAVSPVTIGFLSVPNCPVTNLAEELIPYPAVTCTVSSGTPPYLFTATVLPRGISINPSTGVIGGTPAAGTHQSYTPGVTVQDALGATAFSYTPVLVVYPPPLPTCPALPDGQEGVRYTGVACTSTGGSGSYTWSATGLPGGLSIGSSTGAIGGTPAAGGQNTYSNVQGTVKDSLGGTVTIKASTLVIHPGAVITSLVPATAAAGSADFTLTVNGSGFPSGAQVQWNGAALPTTFVSATKVTAAVPAGLLASAGTASVLVAVGGASTPAAPFTVNPPGQPCTFILSPSSAAFAASGGSAGIQVTASRSDCAWSATTTASFITFSNNNLTGSGTLNYVVAANTASTSRTGAIAVGTQSFLVTQGGVTCIYTLPVTSAAFPAAGGTGTASIEAPPGCAWTATSASPFITISPPAAGSGNGSVTFVVAANLSLGGRSDSFTIANQAFSVSEAGTGAALNCTAAVPSVPQAALEGRAELLGDYVVTCAGLSAPLTADLTLTLNTNVTNTVTSGLTGAVLTVNGGSPQNAAITGYNSIQWTGVTISPAAGAAVLRISKVRADASLLASPGNPQPAAVTGSLGVSALVTVPIASAGQTMANAAPTESFTKSQASPPAGGARTLIPLVFQEASAGSFQPGLTRLRVTLTNVPATVQILAPVFPAEGASHAQLYSADSSGAGGSPVAGSAQPEGAYQLLTPIGGTATATWLVLAGNPAAVETWTFPLLALNAATNDLNQIQVAGSLAPVSDVSIASPFAPVPRYRDFSVPQKLVNLRMSMSLNAAPPAPRAPVSVGSNVTFTQQLVNDTSDPTQVASNVVVRDNLPSGLTLVGCSAAGGVACSSSGNQVQVNYPSLAAGQSETVTVMASVAPSVPEGTVIQNTVSGSSDQASADPFAATASISFIVNDVPLTVGVTPSAGALGSQSFQFQFSHPAGYQNLGVVDILINNSLDGRHACYLAYVVTSSSLVLVDDGGDAGGPYAGSVTLGSSSGIQNSQCAVNLVSAVGNGTTLTLTLNIAFKPAFSGNRIMFVAALSQSLANTDWQALGVWQVPGPPPSPPQIAVGSASPSRLAGAAGTNQQVTFSLTDTAGPGDLGVVNVLINRFIDGRQACYLAYVASTNTLLLVDDAGDAGGPYAGSMVLNGTSASIGNSQCSVSGAGSTATPGANSLSLTLNIALKTPFSGNRVIYLAGRDRHDGNSTGWQSIATWSVP